MFVSPTGAFLLLWPSLSLTAPGPLPGPQAQTLCVLLGNSRRLWALARWGSLRPCTPPCSLPVLQMARWVCEKYHFPWSFCSLIDSGHCCFCWRQGLTMYPGWSAIHYRDQTALKLTEICLPRPSECRPVPTCQALGSFIKQVGLPGGGFLSCFHELLWSLSPAG